MVAAFQTSNTVAGSAATKVLTKPASTVSGDILVVFLFRELTTDPTGVPTGWTQIGTTLTTGTYGAWKYWLRAGGSEPVDYTWTWAASTYGKGFIMRYNAALASGNPIDGAGTGNTGSSTSYVATGFTTSVNDVKGVLAYFNVNDSNIGNATGAQTVTTRVSGDGLGFDGQDVTIPTAGASGNYTATGGSDTFLALMIGILPVAAGGAQDTPELRGRPFGLRGQNQMRQLIVQ